jgi:hypothetical protein
MPPRIAQITFELYNGGSRLIDRIGRGSLNVPNWSASIVGGIQPSALEKAMRGASHDGLLQRFYPIIAHQAPKATNATVDKQHMDNYSLVLDRMNKFGAGTVELSFEAGVILDQAWSETHTLIAGGGVADTLVAHLAKWEGGLYRWTLVMHAMQCAFDATNPIMVPVSADTARIVADLHMQYFLPNIFQLYDEVLSNSGDADHVRWIAGHILAHRCEQITLRDISRVYRKFAAMEEMQKQRIMRMLEDCGWVTPDDPHRQLARSYDVNMLVHERFGDAAALEATRRAEIVKKIRLQ